MCLPGHDVKYVSCCGLEVKKSESAWFSSTYTKAEMKRLASPLHQDAMQIQEALHSFLCYVIFLPKFFFKSLRNLGLDVLCGHLPSTLYP